ncbi:hypothetical protein BC830DRAFT_55078 [Chytriomyces sp. MP71]|nr:hypothetical protein BC830DRAFT_55078 [Chytriomyces sp. MP71]
MKRLLMVETYSRDVCRWKPKGHGQEMLPLALAMFEFQDALSITTALALEVVNVCVQLDITDPRAMWNVHHAAFVTQLGKGGFEGRELLWEKIMAFFALVPAKSEDTEAYQTFKLDIMTTYVLPLTENASLPSRVRSAALGALSAFSPPDLYPYLPPPPEFIPTLVQAPSVGATSLITSLAHHEILNMRRAVFKALAADAGVGRHALDESDDAEKALQRTRRVLRDIASDLRGTWVAGKTGAAVRASLATVALHVPASLCERESGTMLARLQVFKDLVNGLRDVSVTDHAIVRVEAVCLWISFWTQRLSAFGDAAAGSAERVGQVEWLFLAALEELEKRLREAKQPVPCANVLFALTGLVSAAATLGLPSANEHTTRIIRILLQQYARVSVDRASLSELQKSDEVQFGVSLSLGYLSRLLFPTDEESFGAILAQLMSELSLLNDDAQSPFAAGYVLNIVLQTIFSPIAKGGGALQTNALIGLSMGASACLSDVREYIESAEDDEQVTGAIRTVLERFGVDSEATVIGDCWIIAAATVVGMVPEPHNLVSKLDKIVEKALVESSFAPALTHARFARNRILVALGQSGAVTSTLLETMASLSKTASNIPSVDKVSRVLSLMPILGLHPGIAYAPRIATFREIAEFFHKQVTTQDPKIARVMGWVLGKMFAAFDPLYDPAAAAAIGQGLGSSNAFTNSRRKDPSDYRRLNEGSSFLRASFDALSSLTARGITPDTLDSVRMLVSVLVNVGTHPTQPLGLPVVNWIKILNVCWESGDAVLLRDSFLLAAIHASATSAKSLVDFFVARLTSFEGVLQFAFRPEGVGKLLTLGGICERGEVRGDDEDAGNAAAAARIVVAPSKVLEIVQAMVTFVYDKVDHSATDHMIEFAETVQKALLLDITGAPASVMKLREEVLDLICGAFTSFPSEARSTKAILAVRRLTKTALTSRSEASKNILQALLSSDLWTDKTLWSLLHVLEFADSGHEHDWIVAAIKKSFVNKDHLFVSVLQFVFAQDPATTTCYDAACTYLRHVVRTSTPNTANERTIFRLSWIVRYLDVLIIACASHNGASVDAGWARGLSNLFSLLDAQFSVDAIEVMRVMEADWSVMASHVEVALPREVVKSFRFTDKEIATLRSQVAKRLLRLLECTIKAEDLVKQNKASTVRVVIASSTRSGIHNALMRMRDVEEVEEAWLNLVG